MLNITNILLLTIIGLILYLTFVTKKDKSAKSIEMLINEAFTNSNIEKQLGEISVHANEIKNSHRSIEQMLKSPKERGAFGELSLEEILNDQLTENLYGIRKEVLNGKKPDAYIKSSVGIICIDSKFPLDNYLNYLNTDIDKEKDSFKKAFLKNTKSHLQKIKDSYLCPELGSAPFAFAYIPSESIYYYLQTEGFNLLRDFSKLGVQVTSPLTLTHKIELIKADIHTKSLADNIVKVQEDISNLRKRLTDLDNLWKVFYEKHLRNTNLKADELNTSYKKLIDDFDKATQ